MKNIYKLFLVASFAAILGVSCQKEISTNVPEEKAEPKFITVTCAFPTMEDENGTKVSLDASGNTGWQVNDRIAIYGLRRTDQSDDTSMIDPVYHTLTADEITNPQQAVFQVDISTLQPDPDGQDPYNAAYPAQDWTFYSNWYSSARAAFSETNQLLLAGGLAADGTMTLHNLCGAIVFQLPSSVDFDSYVFYGNDGTEVVGYERYLVEVNKSTPNFLAKYGTATYGTFGDKTSISGPVVCDGTTLNHIFIPNEVTFAHGFTIAFAKGGSLVKTIKSKGALTLTHGHMVNLGLLPADKMKDYAHVPESWTSGAIDLSEGKTKPANCYVVSTADAGKAYKIPAVKGNDKTLTLTVGDVEVVWETWNSETTPTENSIIDKVDYDSEWIYFKLAEAGAIHAGNALIAAKNGTGDILWSWHIWMPSTAYTMVNGANICGFSIMDRNLGALVSVGASDAATPESFGFLYQWGRKDPFPGAKAVNSSTRATITKASISTSGGAITMDYAVAHPTVFGNVSGGDWQTPTDHTRWLGSSKTINDPCPAGYRIPYAEKNSKPLWSYDESTKLEIEVAMTAASIGWDVDKTTLYRIKVTDGSNILTIPFCGYIDDGSSSASITHAYDRAAIWALSESSNSCYHLNLRAGSYYEYNSTSKARACSVRCVAE